MQTNRSLMTVVLVLSLLLGVHVWARAQYISLTGVSPDNFQSGPFTLTFTGTGFTPSCVAIIEPAGTPLSPFTVTTVYVSPTQLTVSGTAPVNNSTNLYEAGVYDPATQLYSNPFYFNISPTLVPLTLSPNTVLAASGTLTLSASASNQTPDGLYWTFNSTTTYLTGTRLSPSTVHFTIPASLLTKPGVASVYAPGFTTIPFYVTGNTSISSISPNTASAGDAGFTLTVDGIGFVSGTAVLWNGASLPTTFVSTTQLQAVVPASYVSQRASPQITVNYSYPMTFSINTVHVSGKVSLEGETQTAQTITLEFRPLGSDTGRMVTTQLAGNGAFEVRGIDSAAYNLAVKGYKWLRNTVPLTVGATPVSNVQIALLGGDANDDNAVDTTDFNTLIGAFGGDVTLPGSGYDVTADFNDDGTIDAADFNLLVGNFGLVGAN